jgi:ribosomal protein L19E
MSGSNPKEKWQAKIRCLRQNLMEWAKNMSVTLKKQKMNY